MSKVSTNQATLKGKLSQPEWSFTDNDGIMHFCAILTIERNEKGVDYIPICLTEDIQKKLPKGENFVEITGTVCCKKSKKKLIIYISATNIELLATQEYSNEVYLKGVLSQEKSSRCKKSNSYFIKFHLILSDSKRNYQIPIIAWKERANKINELMPGTSVVIYGKLQNKKCLNFFDIDSSKGKFSFKINTLSFSVEK